MKRITLLFAVLAAMLTNTFAQHEQFGMGCISDEETYNSMPRKAQLITRDLEVLKPSKSLVQYCPWPKSQGQYGTCTSWASAYATRTICEAIANGWTDRNYITEQAFSPIFVYTQIKYRDDDTCSRGSHPADAAHLMKNIGAAKFRETFDINNCASYVPGDMMTEASQYKIESYSTLFRYGSQSTNQEKIRSIKKALNEDRPLLIAMWVYPSFGACWGKDFWDGNTEGKKGAHAMCIVGYDDNKYGGAFQIMNSWGMLWGKQGMIWVRYDDFCNSALEAIEFYVKKNEPSKANAFSGEMYIEEKDGKGHMSLSLKTDGTLNYYKANDTYLSGSKFRLYVSNNEPAWVYVIASDKQNNVAKLFPYADNISANLNYRSNNIALPDETHEFQFDNTMGTDYFCVLYSGEELDINSIVNAVKNTPGSFYDKVSSVLSKKLASNAEIKYESNKIGFSATTNGTIVPLIIEIDHK